MEIERKFLVRGLPPRWRPKGGVPIRQGYFRLSDKDVEIRLRKMGSDYFITIKAGTGRTRLEEELCIPRASFDRLWPLVRSACVSKKRYRIPHDGHTIELDVYEGPLRGLLTAEVEFPSARESNAFVPPEWLGREITGQERYSNQKLARRRS